MDREINNIINDMPEILNASQMQKLQEVLVTRLSENAVSDYLQTDNGLRFQKDYLHSIKRLTRCLLNEEAEFENLNLQRK